MKIILSVCTVCFMFGIVHISAVTDEEFQALFIRLTALEEKQVISDKRIGSLERDIVSYVNRIADLETYWKLSDRRVDMLKRKNDISNRRIIALEKKLSDKTFVEHEKRKTLSDKLIEALRKNMALPDIILQTIETNDTLPMDKTTQNERKVASTDKKIRSTAAHSCGSRRFVSEGNVAFTAIKNLNQKHIGLDQNIIFEQILTNEGGGYDPIHSVFIAPQAGLYVLSSAVTTTSDGMSHTAIVRNGNNVARMYGHGNSGYFDQGSQMIVIRLNAGDEVAVQNIDIPDLTIVGGLYSSFSGFLLLPQ